jgi:hypothetical protein
MMTLDNLVSIGTLQRANIDHGAIHRLVIAAGRHLNEARLEEISSDTRFDLAYKCILKVAMAGLAAEGYRTSQNQPGHHQTAIQCLVWTLGIPTPSLIALDALRKQRNISEYAGDPVSELTAGVCLTEAVSLLERAESKWLNTTPASPKTLPISAKGPPKAAGVP